MFGGDVVATIGERLRMIRKASGLTQSEFGAVLRLKGNSVCRMESGGRNLSPRTIDDICAKFGVSRNWLVDGEGKMSDTPITNDLERLCRTYNIDGSRREFLADFLHMPPEAQNAIMAYYATLRQLAAPLAPKPCEK